MAKSNFESLKNDQIPENLADEIWGLVLEWKSVAKDTIGKQIIRSADRIGANIAEGSGRGSYADNRRFVRVARGSLYETRHWLRRAFRRNLLTQSQEQKLKPMVDNLTPMLNGVLKSIGTKSEKSSQP